MSDEKVVLDHDDLRRTLVRIAHEIVEKNEDWDRLALVGIHTRGAVICRRLHTLVSELTGARFPSAISTSPSTATTSGAACPASAGRPRPHLDFDLEGRTGVLVDDVLYTGPAVRAAIDALFDYGRPARVQAGRARRSRPPELRSGRTTSCETLPTAREAGERSARGNRGSTRSRSPPPG